LDDTLSLVTTLVEAGCQLLVVHGRTKEMKSQRVGECDWESIGVIKRHVTTIPVIANGGISCLEDVMECMKVTGADGVMSSEAILENPGLFWQPSSSLPSPSQVIVASEYLELAQKYPPPNLKFIRAHVFKMLHGDLQVGIIHNIHTLPYPTLPYTNE